MSDKPILIYSNHCKFSTNLLKILSKCTVLYDSFIRMNIDVQPDTKQRPKAFYQIQEYLNKKITKVPTIITQNGEYILSDKDAFKWLEYQIKSLTPPEELNAFNSNEMNSFSDQYSTFGSTDLCDAKTQNYTFFNNGVLPDDNYLQTQKIWDPKNPNGFLDESEEKSKDTDYSNKQSERLLFDQQKNTNKQQIRSNIDFTDSNFGNQVNSSNSSSNASQKQTEIDAKLKQMMLDRKITNDKLNQRQKY